MSSGSIRQPPSGRGGGVQELVEALLGRGADEPARDVAQAGRGHRPLTRGVARGRDRVVDLDEDRGQPEARLPRGHHVARPLGHGRVGVVDDERLLRVQADGEEGALARRGCAAGRARRARASRGTGRGRASSCPSPARRTGSRPPLPPDGSVRARDPLPRTGRAHAARSLLARPRARAGRSTPATRSSSARSTPAGAWSRTRAGRTGRAASSSARPTATRSPARSRSAARGQGMTLRIDIGDVIPGAWGACLAGGWESDFNERLGVVGDGVVARLHARRRDDDRPLAPRPRGRAAAVPRRDGHAARRARRALDDPAAHVRREPRLPRADQRRRRCTCRSPSTARCSRAATATPPRATARSRAPRSSARSSARS